MKPEGLYWEYNSRHSVLLYQKRSRTFYNQVGLSKTPVL